MLMFNFLDLFTLRSLCVSGFVLSAVMGSMAQVDRSPEMTLSHVSGGLLSAQTDQSQDAEPYRGSGRRRFSDVSVPGSSLEDML